MSLDQLIAMGSRVTEATTQALLLEELSSLTFEDIESFYEEE